MSSVFSVSKYVARPMERGRLNQEEKLDTDCTEDTDGTVEGHLKNAPIVKLRALDSVP